MKYSSTTTEKIKKVCELIQSEIELKGLRVDFDDTHTGINKQTARVVELLAKNEKIFEITRRQLAVYPEEDFMEKHDFFTVQVNPKKFDKFIRNELHILPPSIESVGEIKEIAYVSNFREFLLNGCKDGVKLYGGKKPADIIDLLWAHRRIIKKGRVVPEQIGKFVSINLLKEGSNTKTENGLIKQVERINKFFHDNYLPIRLEDENKREFRLVVKL